MPGNAVSHQAHAELTREPEIFGPGPIVTGELVLVERPTGLRVGRRDESIFDAREPFEAAFGDAALETILHRMLSCTSSAYPLRGAVCSAALDPNWPAICTLRERWPGVPTVTPSTRAISPTLLRFGTTARITPSGPGPPKPRAKCREIPCS